jgi:hypothetical protein
VGLREGNSRLYHWLARQSLSRRLRAQKFLLR